MAAGQLGSWAAGLVLVSALGLFKQVDLAPSSECASKAGYWLPPPGTVAPCRSKVHTACPCPHCGESPSPKTPNFALHVKALFLGPSWMPIVGIGE